MTFSQELQRLGPSRGADVVGVEQVRTILGISLYLHPMASRLVLAAITLSVFLFGYRVLILSDEKRASLSTKPWGILSLSFGLFMLAIGLGNLFSGFTNGKLLWVSFHGNTFNEWFDFEGHEAAYIYISLLSSAWVLFGAASLRIWAASRQRH